MLYTPHAYQIFNHPHVREAIEHLLRTRAGITKTWLVDKLATIIDTDLADVSDWGESGELIFKASAELTPEQRVAVPEIVKERSREGSTLKIRLYDKARGYGAPRQAAQSAF